MDNNAQLAVQLRGITKRFGSFTANDNIDIDIHFGEVHGLLGENGAGKTTLMNILFGLLHPDEGTITVKGKKVMLKNPESAKKAGIQMVHQHFMLAMPFSAIDNIILGHEPTEHKLFIDRKSASEEVKKYCDICGFQFDCNQKVEDLPIASRQKVEIIRALYNKCDILILDEPTAVLSVQESDELLDVIRRLKEQGKAIILITHKLNEALQVCDEISVLRHGKLIETRKADEFTKETLAMAMVGRRVLFDMPERVNLAAMEPLLEFNDVSTGNRKNDLKNINLELKQGEIFGIAGVEGNGQKSLVETILGLCEITNGSLKFAEKDIKMYTKRQIINLTSHIVEDRHNEGYLNDFTVTENMLLGRQREEQFAGGHTSINDKAVERYSNDIIEQYDVRVSSLKTLGKSLSGGNQQKLVIGREFTKPEAKLIIAEQPSRGLDIASTEYVQKCLIKMRNLGKSILLISADLDELMSLSDRIAVLYEGRVAAIGKTSDFNDKQLGMYMTGGGTDER